MFRDMRGDWVVAARAFAGKEYLKGFKVRFDVQYRFFISAIKKYIP